MKCITDIKIIIHPSVWHVCVPLHQLVLIFLADSFYNGFFSKLYDQDETPDLTHTQLHYIARDNVLLLPLIRHSCPQVQCTSGEIAAIITPAWWNLILYFL